MTYKLKVLQQELEQEETSHKTTRALLADKSKIKVTIEGAKSESMKGKPAPPPPQTFLFFLVRCCSVLINEMTAFSETEQKLAEERAAKIRLENRILELEKHSSMMDCDYKQALQKLDELRRHKDQLTEEVRHWGQGGEGKSDVGHPFEEDLHSFIIYKKIHLAHRPFFQMKNMTLKIEQETQKRSLTQNDLKAQNQQLSSLRTSEKQLKQEMNHLLDIKRSLEKQNQELRKSVMAFWFLHKLTIVMQE